MTIPILFILIAAVSAILLAATVYRQSRRCPSPPDIVDLMVKRPLSPGMKRAFTVYAGATTGTVHEIEANESALEWRKRAEWDAQQEYSHRLENIAREYLARCAVEESENENDQTQNEAQPGTN